MINIGEIRSAHIWFANLITALLTAWLAVMVVRLAHTVTEQNAIIKELLTILTDVRADDLIRKLNDR